MNNNEKLEKVKNLWEVNDEIYRLSLTNEKKLQSIYDKIKNDESDYNLMVMLLLWVNPNSIFKNSDNYCNSFTKFLHSLKDESSDFFNQEIKWFYTSDNHLVFVKDDLLVIMNNNDYEISSQLPDEYINQTLHCENCNEEISVTTYINVPGNTFYIISK